MKAIKSILIISNIFLLSCGPEEFEVQDQLAALPSSVSAPADNPTTNAKVILGRTLFWDPVLSGNNDVACATCHHPNNGYTDNIDLSLGVGGSGLAASRSGGTLIKRNAPTVINSGFNGIQSNGSHDPANAVMFWDNRTKSLEAQALGPIKSEEEMRGNVYTEANAISTVSARLAAIPQYVTLFTNAFGDGTVNGDRIGKAISAFQRSIVANNSKFDRFARGDDNALNELEIRGLNKFISVGCINCHGGPMFSDYSLHNISVPQNSKLSEADTGVGGKFRTPTLRNLSVTGPYMHNGSKATIREAIEHYINLPNPDNDPDIENMDMDDNPATIDALEAFLKALDDNSFDKTIPNSVPSATTLVEVFKLKVFVLILLSLVSSLSHAYLPFYQPLPQKSSLLKVGYINLFELADYERNEVPFDSIQLRGNIAEVDYTWKNNSQFEYQIVINYLFSGDFKETYSGELSSIPNNEEDTTGFKEPLLVARYWLPIIYKDKFQHAVEVGYRPKLFEPKVSSFADGRHTLKAKYFFTYSEYWLEIAGDVYTNIYSKRELILEDNLTDETESFSEAGFNLRPGLLFQSSSIHLIFGYASTTDYNTRNPLYTRQSDKGFIFNYGINYKYELGNRDYIELQAGWKFTTFNSIEESPNTNVEFKIEDRNTAIRWWRTF